MDLGVVRARILVEMERLKLNPNQLADRADVNQSSLNAWLKSKNARTEMRARVLFQVIERGLKVPLSQFFREIEGGTIPAIGGPSTTEGHSDAASILSAGVADPAVARALGQTLIDAGSRLIAAHGSGAPETDREISPDRRPKPTRRNRRSGNR